MSDEMVSIRQQGQRLFEKLKLEDQYLAIFNGRNLTRGEFNKMIASWL